MFVQLTDEAIARFHRNGWIAIDNVASQNEVARMRAILCDMYEKNVGFDEGALFDAVGHDGDVKERRFPQILNPSVYAKELTATAFFRSATAVAKQLLGPKARFKLDIAFMKPPRIGSDTAWHQDDAFGNPAYDQNEITIWLAVTPANRTNSCMSFISGSHLGPVLEHRPVGDDPSAHALECIGTVDASAAVECPLAAGSATVHTRRTLHYAGPNYSDEFRLAYALLFNTPAMLRKVPLDFSWKRTQATARDARERIWKRKHFLLYIWRYLRAGGVFRAIEKIMIRVTAVEKNIRLFQPLKVSLGRKLARRSHQFRKLMILLRSKNFRRGLRHGVAASIEHIALIQEIKLGTLIDVGANVGQFSLMTRKVHPDAKIFAFEPLLRPAERYQKLFAGDMRTTFYRCAIGPKAEATMYVGHRDDGSSLLPNSDANEISGTEEVTVCPLDEVLTVTDLVGPTMIKIDVQGYEMVVLQSCGALLDGVKYVYVEASFKPFYVGQALANEVIEFLQSRHFVLTSVHNPECSPTGYIQQADFLFSRA